MLGKGLTMLFDIQALKMLLVLLQTHVTPMDYHYWVICQPASKSFVPPSDMSKAKFYKNYKATCVQQQLRPMKKCFLQGMVRPTRQYRHNEACHRLRL